jgi:tetratricopeptide (TPR) repeat protein
MGSALAPLVLALVPRAGDVPPEWPLLLHLGRAEELVHRARARVAPEGDLAADGQAVALVARALRETGRGAEARALLDAAEVEPGGEGHIEVERGRAALAAGDTAAALELVAAPLDGAEPVRRPEVLSGFLVLAQARAAEGRLDLAAQAASRALELDPFGPDASQAWLLLGRAAVVRGDAAAAAACAEEATRRGRWAHRRFTAELRTLRLPESILPRLELARVWLEARRPETALSVLAETRERWPDDARIAHLTGEALRQQDRLEEALSAYGEALRRSPHLAPARRARALLLLRLGEAEKARSELEILLRTEAGRDPEYLEAHLQLARLLLSEGRLEEARARHARYLELGGQAPLEP